MNKHDRSIGFSSVAFLGALGALILAAFALRVFRLGVQDIWWDEARNIFTASRSILEIASAPELDIHPPLYFYLFHFWIQVAGTTEFVVRFFSLWFGVATVALAFRLGTFLKDQHVGFWAAFFTALSPFFVDEAQQTRMYTLAIFLSTLSFYLLLRAVNTQHRKHWIAYTLVATASFYTHYSFIYILAAQNLYLAYEFWNRWRCKQTPRDFFVHWAATQIGIASLYLFQVPNILRQLKIYGNPGMTPPTLAQYASDLTRAFLLGEKINLAARPLAELAIVGVLLVVLGALFVSQQERLANRDVEAVILWLIVPLIAYFLILQKSPQFTPRYIMIATLPLFVLLALSLGKLTHFSVLLGALPATLLLIASFSAWQSMYFDPAFANDDTRGLAQFISKTATKEDIVFIDVPFPFGYYYHGAAPAHYLFVDVHTVADVLNQMTQGRQRIFYITWYKSDTDPQGYVPYLLDKYAVHQGDRAFRGYYVTWYQLPHEPTFSLAPSPQPASATFGNQVMLTAFAYGGVVTPKMPNPDAPSIAEGSRGWAALWWKVTQQVRENYKVSVQLSDAEGNLVAQDDRMLLDDRHLATSLWTTQETAINVYTPELGLNVRPGEYTINVIVYDPDTGRRLRIGTSDMFALGKIEVVP